MAEVSTDGVWGDVEALGDLSVGEAVGDQPDAEAPGGVGALAQDLELQLRVAVLVPDAHAA